MTNEETDAEMYEYAIETLTAIGYKHYEISNFAKSGCECRHNINYWKNGNYIGIGAGAHSHYNGKRWANTDSIEEYIENKVRVKTPVWKIGEGIWAKPQKTNNHTGIQTLTQQRESIFMGLRLLEGLKVDKFQGFETEVEELLKDGLLIKNNGHLKLSHQGLFLANLVFEKFI